MSEIDFNDLRRLKAVRVTKPLLCVIIFPPRTQNGLLQLHHHTLSATGQVIFVSEMSFALSSSFNHGSVIYNCACLYEMTPHTTFTQGPHISFAFDKGFLFAGVLQGEDEKRERGQIFCTCNLNRTETEVLTCKLAAVL